MLRNTYLRTYLTYFTPDLRHLFAACGERGSVGA